MQKKRASAAKTMVSNRSRPLQSRRRNTLKLWLEQVQCFQSIASPTEQEMNTPNTDISNTVVSNRSRPLQSRRCIKDLPLNLTPSPFPIDRVPYRVGDLTKQQLTYEQINVSNRSRPLQSRRSQKVPKYLNKLRCFQSIASPTGQENLKKLVSNSRL